ncbi:hypothetical protein IMAU30132_01011 [Lactobacillus helveticus]|nr:hypothetical protein [Lactobacillus helveticus]
MRRFIGIILNAKYAIEKAHKDLGVWITLDDPELKPLMTKTLRRYFQRPEKQRETHQERRELLIRHHTKSI